MFMVILHDVQTDTLTPKEAADLLDRHYETVLRWIKAGTLKGWKLGGQYRVKRQDVERLLTGDAA